MKNRIKEIVEEAIKLGEGKIKLSDPAQELMDQGYEIIKFISKFDLTNGRAVDLLVMCGLIIMRSSGLSKQQAAHYLIDKMQLFIQYSNELDKNEK